MGFGIGLGAEEYDRIYKDRDLVKRVLRYFSPYKTIMILVIGFVFLQSIANSLIPIISREAINKLEVTTSIIEQQYYILLLIIITLVLNSLGWGFNYIRQSYTAQVIGDVVLNLRQDVNLAVLNHDMSFFDKYPTGKIVSRINTDSRDFGQTANQLMMTASSLLLVIIMFGVMFSINAPLTLVVIALVPFIFLITLSFRKMARRLTLLGQRALAVVNTFVQESFSGIQIAKTFRQETKLFNKFKDVNQQSYLVNRKRAYLFNLLFPAIFTIQGVALALLIIMGGGAVLNGDLKAGDFYLFLQSLQLFFFPLFTIASFWPSFQSGLAASERIFALIDSPPIVVQRNNIIREKIEGEIIFDNLEFSYIEAKDVLGRKKENNNERNRKSERVKVFDEFSLTVKPGESLAIVGHTGAGKSSLAKLLARFYEFQKGDILIDGVSIRDFNLKAYRKHIGIIHQVPFLWGDTLENNVKYGKQDATREEVLWALEQAGGVSWVEDLPQGLETNIRERGALLSMGQRQLVALSRVLLENPSVLILDEATASVDPFTETRIQEALEKTIKGRTSIIIAHRLWTVRRVNRIIVLDHGKIVEEGNHDELMQLGGYYAKLYDTYFRHQSLEYIEKAREFKDQ
ncbi:MAG: ABC transporter ATP-binding protein [Candidatus Hodarchaeales archaeon]|jgi:ABC-type multidrug transport system fused ATPase/permease subunit